jgi:hypothetical protein
MKVAPQFLAAGIEDVCAADQSAKLGPPMPMHDRCARWLCKKPRA